MWDQIPEINPSLIQMLHAFIVCKVCNAAPDLPNARMTGLVMTGLVRVTGGGGGGGLV